ncbi:uracil-DNA glycosylase [soil metagenome]
MSALARLVDQGLMADDWAAALAPVDERIGLMGDFLRADVAAGHRYQPAGDAVFRAFQRPLADVRVLIVGQDPYPNPRHPIGLSFAVERDLWPLPASLVNIYTELRADVGQDSWVPPRHGDLSGWADQGVMLLNRVLSVRANDANSHRGKGWEEVTECAIRALAVRAESSPLAAILWGRPAQSLKPLLGPIPWVESAHPSPLAAYRGFFGSRPFSRVNALLVERGVEPVDWTALAEHDASRDV